MFPIGTITRFRGNVLPSALWTTFPRKRPAAAPWATFPRKRAFRIDT
jgi:hypothetical protein